MQLTDKKERALSNEDIFDGIKHRDRVVLRSIYDSYFPMIMDLILKNSGNQEDARDIFHDALTVIFEKINKEQLSISSSFKTYFYAICKNLWLMSLRKKKTAQKINDLNPNMEDSIEINEQDLLYHQRYKLYMKHFDKMGEDCKKILKLFLQGESLKNIAVEMGFTDSYAKKRKHTCQKQLILAIEGDGSFNELRS
ncbi:sigma-70 family RNA polymerase sigma factor [Fulvivirgaceae bacterium BMA10]|uniref:Sigma-70 family RNA polymerase sigma factor n=1 Tax=Splendidivirga corallicola TaxID=3051826 RepID=A0ABT8KLV3_9BACT|nr:sigma-70 family RNA polymerase sigma factor [Fulvivirgaceae bacterium BMA10]